MSTGASRRPRNIHLEADAPVNQSVERAISMLGFFSAEEPELTLAQLTTRLGASKATTHRYTLALRRTGLLRFDSSRGVYSLGVRLVELAAGALSGLRVATIALPHVERLVSETNQSSILSIWDGHAPIVVVGAEGADGLVRISIPHGSRLPLTSASGKIFEAFRADLELSGTSKRELGLIRKHHFATDRGPMDCFRTIAAPVFQTGQVVAALAFVGTTSSIPTQPTAPLGETLRAAARLLSSELGLND